MITICILPNFNGTKLQHSKVLLLCLFLDMSYILPLLIS